MYRWLEAAELTLEELKVLCDKCGTPTTSMKQLKRIYKSSKAAEAIRKREKYVTSKRRSAHVQSARTIRKKSLRRALVRGALIAAGFFCGMLGVVANSMAWKIVRERGIDVDC